MTAKNAAPLPADKGTVNNQMTNLLMMKMEKSGIWAAWKTLMPGLWRGFLTMMQPDTVSAQRHIHNECGVLASMPLKRRTSPPLPTLYALQHRGRMPLPWVMYATAPTVLITSTSDAPSSPTQTMWKNVVSNKLIANHHTVEEIARQGPL